jgi:hypothetical protein
MMSVGAGPDTWSAGSVTLCKKSAATNVTRKRIDPVTISVHTTEVPCGAF